jgi:predicted PurR-regulated permease PerM
MFKSFKPSLQNIKGYCWLALISIVLLFVYLNLVKLIVFLLFIYLINDLILTYIGKTFKFLPSILVLYITTFLIVALAVLVMAFIIPLFVKDLPIYIDKLQIAINTQLSSLLSHYQLADFEVGNFKESILTWIKEHLSQTLILLNKIGLNIFLFILALIINFAISHSNLDAKNHKLIHNRHGDDFLSYLTAFIAEQVSLFYQYFKTVMSAQLIISTINSVLTLCLLFFLGIPHKITLIVFVFILGLLPVIGNIISNTIICTATILWSGLWQVVIALLFLVGIHKLEYILNGKIIGRITSLPLYVTLISLIVGELLFNISGMILAIPTVLFLKEELKRIKIS